MTTVIFSSSLACPFDLNAQEPPINASLVGQWDDYSGTYADLWADGEFVYLGNFPLDDDNQAQIQIINISDPALPFLESTYFIPEPNHYASTQDVHVVDGIMFVALYGGGYDDVAIVDVRIPDSPQLLALINIPEIDSSVHTLTYDSGYLFLAPVTRDVFVVDMTDFDPDDPPRSPLTSYKWHIENVGNSFVHEVTALNGRLYCAAWSSGLWVYDISRLVDTAPQLLGWVDGNATHTAWPTEDGKFVVTAEERYTGPINVYRIDDSGEELTFMLTDVVGFSDDAYSVHQPVIVGYRLYCAWYQAGLHVYDIDPDTGELIFRSSFDTSQYDGESGGYSGAWGVYPYRGSEEVLVSDMQNGLFVIETLSLECTPGEDCNSNGVNDECDLESGTSDDCGGDGIPDECEQDCNENGIPDICDIAAGIEEDCDGDGILDDCLLQTQVVFGDGSEGAGFGSAVDFDGKTLILGAIYASGPEYDSGTASVFSFDGEQAQLQQELFPGDGQDSGYFGQAVVIEGDSLMVGASGDDSGGASAGAAYVYRFNGAEWLETQKLLPESELTTALFGESLAMAEDFAIISSIGDDTLGDSAGAANVYKFDGAEWTFAQKLFASDAAIADNFSKGVAIDGELALVGAPYNDLDANDQGSAYTFRFDGQAWIEEQILTADDGRAGDHFGYAVAIDDEIIAIGADGVGTMGGADRGAVYIYRNTGATWIPEAKLLADGGQAGDSFGRSVALYGSTLVAGAELNSDLGSWSGAAYVFRFNGSEWIQIKKLLPSDGQQYMRFGESVSVFEDFAWIGAPEADQTAYNAGAAYLFVGVGGDCNVNGIQDECDIADGISQDSNGNGNPDECEPRADCDGDVNGDKNVDPLDSGYVLSRFSCTVGQGDPLCDAADANLDGIVDPLDVGYVMSRFGECL